MKAFHNNPEIKEKYINRVLAHQKADEIIKGTYWENGKGCAVGCTIHSDKHKDYEAELGIPEWLARLEDALFEGLPNDRAKTWPYEFLNAIKPGIDLDQIKTPFLIFILEQNLKSLDACKFDKEAWPDVTKAIDLSRDAITQMIDCHKNGKDTESAAESARSAAESAWSAESAAWSAAWSAAESAWSAARSAWSAAESARSAAESARSAARSAESAAWAAWSAAESAWSAESAAWSAAWSAARSAWSAAESAWSAARSAAFELYADKLLEFIGNCEVLEEI